MQEVKDNSHLPTSSPAALIGPYLCPKCHKPNKIFLNKDSNPEFVCKCTPEEVTNDFNNKNNKSNQEISNFSKGESCFSKFMEMNPGTNSNIDSQFQNKNEKILNQNSNYYLGNLDGEGGNNQPQIDDCGKMRPFSLLMNPLGENIGNNLGENDSTPQTQSQSQSQNPILNEQLFKPNYSNKPVNVPGRFFVIKSIDEANVMRVSFIVF